MRGERSFRFDAQGRELGRFRGVEQAKGEVALLGWEWARGAGPPAAAPSQGAIVLTGPGDEELRRWACRCVDWTGDRPVVSRIRRLS